MIDEIQKNWLLETFFKTDRFANWKGIGTALIEKGICFVPDSEDPLWIGGIGNFINSEKSDEGIDILKLTFDLQNFCSPNNNYFMEAYVNSMEKIEEEFTEIEQKRESVESLKYYNVKKYTITKSNFLEWYFNTGSDQEQESTSKELGESIIESLFDNSNGVTITTEEIFKQSNHDCIPFEYIEEDSNDELYDEVYELGDLSCKYKLSLVD